MENYFLLFYSHSITNIFIIKVRFRTNTAFRDAGMIIFKKLNSIGKYYIIYFIIFKLKARFKYEFKLLFSKVFPCIDYPDENFSNGRNSSCPPIRHCGSVSLDLKYTVKYSMVKQHDIKINKASRDQSLCQSNQLIMMWREFLIFLCTFKINTS